MCCATSGHTCTRLVLFPFRSHVRHVGQHHLPAVCEVGTWHTNGCSFSALLASSTTSVASIVGRVGKIRFSMTLAPIAELAIMAAAAILLLLEAVLRGAELNSIVLY